MLERALEVQSAAVRAIHPQGRIILRSRSDAFRVLTSMKSNRNIRGGGSPWQAKSTTSTSDRHR